MLAVAVGLVALSSALAAPGRLDPAFGTGGKVLSDWGGYDAAGAVSIQPDGAVLVTGVSSGDLALSRYDGSGRPDAAFGAGGTVRTDLGSNENGESIALLRDGRIVVAGDSGDDIAVTRFTPTGALDRTLAGDGSLVHDLGGADSAGTVLLQSGGRMVVAVATTGGLALVRFLADGRLDPSFGSGGTARLRLPGLGDPGRAGAALAPGGTIVLAGPRLFLTGSRVDAIELVVARYTADGRLDRSFGRNGVARTGRLAGWSAGGRVAVQPDGKVVLVARGRTRSGGAGLAVVRLGRGGRLDRTFSADGLAVSRFGYAAHAVALDRRGRIVVAGDHRNLRDFAVIRFLRDGRVDPAFSATRVDFGSRDTPFAAAVDGRGRVVVVGASGAYGGLYGDVAIARYLAGG